MTVTRRDRGEETAPQAQPLVHVAEHTPSLQRLTCKYDVEHKSGAFTALVAILYVDTYVFRPVVTQECASPSPLGGHLRNFVSGL